MFVALLCRDLCFSFLSLSLSLCCLHFLANHHFYGEFLDIKVKRIIIRGVIICSSTTFPCFKLCEPSVDYNLENIWSAYS